MGSPTSAASPCPRGGQTAPTATDAAPPTKARVTDQAVSRLDRGASRENRPKYKADRGTVNTMAPRLMAATPTRGLAHRRQALGSFSSHPWLHRRPKRRMPRVARKENCSPALATL